MRRVYGWIVTGPGLKLVEILDAFGDKRGRPLVRKWRAASRRWTQPRRTEEVVNTLDAAEPEIRQRLERLLRAADTAVRP